MAKNEIQQIVHQMLNVYRGILFHHLKFEEGKHEDFIYEFDCPEFEELRNRYHLVKIAGNGSDFVRAKRLLHYLATRLTHSSWYDNHIECNALKLLEYRVEQPEHGSNCRHKSKIFVECCLAIGIFARRVTIMPFSPYDFDNHVVAEIYDCKLAKWIMLDVTTDGYFIDETKTPLSLIEIREKFARAQFVTYVPSQSSLNDIEKICTKYAYENMYICKNLFYFKVEKHAAFGEKNSYLYFVPSNYSVKNSKQANLEYRIANLPAEQETLRNLAKTNLAQLKQFHEPDRVSVDSMRKKPF